MSWLYRIINTNHYRFAATETVKLKLDKRTLDFVTPGEQQSEADHKLRSDKYHYGIANESMYHDAANGGSFSYGLSTKTRAT